jgi:phosphopantothenoylcysteine synthetase/decarboxylase
MPGSMDGLRLAKYVRTKWPPIKIIATSGHFAKPAAGSRINPQRRYQA